MLSHDNLENDAIAALKEYQVFQALLGVIKLPNPIKGIIS